MISPNTRFCVSSPCMLYHILKLIIGFGIQRFYREIRVKNREYLDAPGPKIVIVNHPNTLMDAWLIGHICNQRIYYMAKGTFFSSRFKSWILGGLGMIPINRQVDAKMSGVSNEDSFEACYQLLKEGKTIVIFPEGNSFQERLLRKLKSGTARIALEAELRNEGKLNLKIIPIGLVYVRPEKFRSSVMANIGAPIDPLPHLELFKTDTLKAARRLTEEFRVSLSRLLVHSEYKEEEGLVESIVHLLSSEYIKTPEKGVERDVTRMREVFDQMSAIRVSQPWKISEITLLVESLKLRVKYLHIKSDFLDRKYKTGVFVRQLIFSTIFLLIGLPFFLFGMLHNFPQYKFVDLFVQRFVKDVEYHAPVSVLASLLVYPVTYALWGIGVNALFDVKGWWLLTYLAVLPAGGLFAYYYARYYRHVSLKRTFIFLMRKRKSDIETLRQERESLRQLVFEN